MRTRGFGAVLRSATAALALVGAVAFATAMSASPASASQGSVPSVVSNFTTDPRGLIAELKDLFGRGAAAGGGIAFDTTTKIGQVNRIFTLSPDFVAGTSTDNPLEWQNLWSAPISLGDKPVGLAVIGIDPNTNAPTLASFTPEAALATALANVGTDVYLVHDEPRAAWLTLTDTTFTTLVAGISGASAQVSLGEYQRLILATAAQTNTATQVPTLAVLVLIVVVVGLGILIWLPSRRASAISASRDAAAPALASDIGMVSVAVPEPSEPAIAKTRPGPLASSTAPAPKPPASKRPPVASPVSKPPASTAPRATSAAAKTPVTKPPVSKPPVRKPPAVRPPTSGPQPAPKPKPKPKPESPPEAPPAE